MSRSCFQPLEPKIMHSANSPDSLAGHAAGSREDFDVGGKLLEGLHSSTPKPRKLQKRNHKVVLTLIEKIYHRTFLWLHSPAQLYHVIHVDCDY